MLKKSVAFSSVLKVDIIIEGVRDEKKERKKKGTDSVS